MVQALRPLALRVTKNSTFTTKIQPSSLFLTTVHKAPSQANTHRTIMIKLVERLLSTCSPQNKTKLTQIISDFNDKYCFHVDNNKFIDAIKTFIKLSRIVEALDPQIQLTVTLIYNMISFTMTTADNEVMSYDVLCTENDVSELNKYSLTIDPESKQVLFNKEIPPIFLAFENPPETNWLVLTTVIERTRPIVAEMNQREYLEPPQAKILTKDLEQIILYSTALCKQGVLSYEYKSDINVLRITYRHDQNQRPITDIFRFPRFYATQVQYKSKSIHKTLSLYDMVTKLYQQLSNFSATSDLTQLLWDSVFPIILIHNLPLIQTNSTNSPELILYMNFLGIIIDRKIALGTEQYKALVTELEKMKSLLNSRSEITELCKYDFTDGKLLTKKIFLLAQNFLLISSLQISINVIASNEQDRKPIEIVLKHNGTAFLNIRLKSSMTEQEASHLIECIKRLYHPQAPTAAEVEDFGVDDSNIGEMSLADLIIPGNAKNTLIEVLNCGQAISLQEIMSLQKNCIIIQAPKKINTPELELNICIILLSYDKKPSFEVLYVGPNIGDVDSIIEYPKDPILGETSTQDTIFQTVSLPADPSEVEFWRNDNEFLLPAALSPQFHVLPPEQFDPQFLIPAFHDACFQCDKIKDPENITRLAIFMATLSTIAGAGAQSVP